MFHKRSFLLILIPCLYSGNFGLPVSAQNVTNDTLFDRAIEFFHNCKCIPYYLCSVANRYMLIATTFDLPKELKCSQSTHTCCRNETLDVELPSETTTPGNGSTEKPKTTTPEKPSTEKPKSTTPETTGVDLRGVNFDVSCGVARTQLSLRILTSDTESAGTVPGEFPWMVEIFRRDGKGYELRCAGSLIHEKVVLTATHCIRSVAKKPENLKILASGNEVFQKVGANADDERNVAKVIQHPGFYSGGLYNDIALLILDRPYNFQDTLLNAVCLPKVNQTFDGERCIATGWGGNVDSGNKPLNKVDVPVVSFDECQRLIKQSSMGKDYVLHPSFVCAGGEEGKDTCKGDGGGPLVCLGENYKFEQVGIVSWGIDQKCGIKNQPGIYANVALFTNWIKEELMKEDITI